MVVPAALFLWVLYVEWLDCPALLTWQRRCQRSLKAGCDQQALWQAGCAPPLQEHTPIAPLSCFTVQEHVQVHIGKSACCQNNASRYNVSCKKGATPLDILSQYQGWPAQYMNGLKIQWLCISMHSIHGVFIQFWPTLTRQYYCRMVLCELQKI